jgi:hypothetical protein
MAIAGTLFRENLTGDAYEQFVPTFVDAAKNQTLAGDPIVSKLFSTAGGAFKAEDHTENLERRYVERIYVDTEIGALDLEPHSPPITDGRALERVITVPPAPIFTGGFRVTYSEMVEAARQSRRVDPNGKMSIYSNTIFTNMEIVQEVTRQQYATRFARGKYTIDVTESDAAVLARDTARFAPSLGRLATLWGGNAALSGGVLTVAPPDPHYTATPTGALQFAAPASQTGNYLGVLRTGSASGARASERWHNQYEVARGVSTLDRCLSDMRRKMYRTPRYGTYGFPLMGLADEQTVAQILHHQKDRMVAVGNKAEQQQIDQALVISDVDEFISYRTDSGDVIQIYNPPSLDYANDTEIQALGGVLMLVNEKTLIRTSNVEKLDILTSEAMSALPWFNDVKTAGPDCFRTTDWKPESDAIGASIKAAWLMSMNIWMRELCFNGAITGTVDADNV